VGALGSALSPALIQRSAGKQGSANFVLTGFIDVASVVVLINFRRG